jgi:spore coat protein JB
MEDKLNMDDRLIMDDRLNMLKKVQKYEFTLVEANLFLDTHPNDQQALEYFKMQRKHHEEAVMEYTKKYGPLTAANGIYENKWTWVDGPWPWEYQMEAMT